MRANRVLLAVLVVALSGCGAPDMSSDPVEVACVKVPPAGAKNAHYLSNRAPLLRNPLVKLPIGAIEPRGWLLGQLELMRDGMYGRLQEISKYCVFEGNAWASPTGEGHSPWEELPYWLRGYGDLGYVLKDERIIKDARRWFDAVLRNQREDGYIGPRANLHVVRDRQTGGMDLWPNMIVCDALKTFHEYTGDPRVIPFLMKYMRWQVNVPDEKFLHQSWQNVRGGDNLDTVLWLYNRTGADWLIGLAHKVHANTAKWTDSWEAGWKHVCNTTQCYREPAQYYMLSKDPKHLEATERNYRDVMRWFGQMPGGMFAGDENCRDPYYGPRQSSECCSMVEFMRSFEMMLAMTGRPIDGDRCEDVAYNSLPCCGTPDWKAIHYFTAPNQVLLDHGEKAPVVCNPGMTFGYSPGEIHRCCQHNVIQVWPYFAEHLWMATHDNGLAAVFFCENAVTAKVADGQEVTIAESTDYPFDEQVTLKISTSKPVRFPLYLRIPKWCEGAKVSVNGAEVAADLEPLSWAKVTRAWRDGDTIRLDLPMRIETRVWKDNRNSVSVHRGPLAYSLKIGEKWVKNGGTEEWPEWDVLPTTPWNYGLVVDLENPASSFEVVKKRGKLARIPFTHEGTPVALKAKGKRIDAWRMDRYGVVGRLQDSPVKSGAPEEEITLVPMGCARLRISAFPQIGGGPDAKEWKPVPKFETSHVCRVGWLIAHPDAVYELKEPTRCGDRRNQMFGYWDKRGSTEWLAAIFEKPREVSTCRVYWFKEDPKGRAKAPVSWKLYFRQNGDWKEVENPSGYGVELDKWNVVKFKPVVTDAMKLETLARPDETVGILEWWFE